MGLDRISFGSETVLVGDRLFISFYPMKKSFLLVAALAVFLFYFPQILKSFDYPPRLLSFSFPIFAETVNLEIPDLRGKVAVVTGGNAGIGLETVRSLAGAGCTVVMASRDVARGEEARAKVQGNVIVKKLDLADLSIVENFAKEVITLNLGRLDFLVLNAGKWPQGIKATADGLEWMVGSHHVGHFHLTNLLMPLIKKTLKDHKEARVVVTSSAAMVLAPTSPVQWKTFEKPDSLALSDSQAYGASKLANALFALELDKRYRKSGLIVSANHPGSVATELHYLQPCNYMLGLCFTPTVGAFANLQGCYNKDAAGKFFLPGGAMGNEDDLPSYAKDEKAASDLWKWTEKVIAAKRR